MWIHNYKKFVSKAANSGPAFMGKIFEITLPPPIPSPWCSGGQEEWDAFPRVKSIAAEFNFNICIRVKHIKLGPFVREIGSLSPRRHRLVFRKSLLHGIEILQLDHMIYIMAKKFWHILYRFLLYKLGQDFLDTQLEQKIQCHIYKYHLGT